MSCFRQFFGQLLVSVLSASAPAWADVVVSSSLNNLTQLTISPSSGWLFGLPPVTTSDFVQALDSTDGFDQESGSASASAATLFANGSVTAQPVTGSVAANVNLPIQFQRLRQLGGASSAVRNVRNHRYHGIGHDDA